ncbi:MAG TPA: SIMPL domain-containing protein [Alphaproteobacteria bacterium]|nr:SIMPL domain-containing protein [Alphaproteobacteria bacterium]
MANPFTVLAALLLAFGLSFMGYAIGDGLRHIKPSDRAVSVRGLAEREVMADTARLIISFSHSGDTSSAIIPQMQETQKKILAFLDQNGLKKDEAEYSPWSTGQASSAEERAKDKSLPRLTTNGDIKITTHDVQAAQKVFEQINDLQAQTNGGVSGADITYQFTGIAAIRAEMIAAATKDARNAALQFAADSNSQVGAIRSASQGAFSVNTPGQDNDDPRSLRKSVRVVTTVDYELRD